MLTWPHPGTDWAADLPAVETLYTRIVEAVAPRERLLVVCVDADHRNDVRSRLEHCPGVAESALVWAHAPSDDTWARDHGPLCVLDADGRPRLLDFRFNGWGGKFPAERDDRITGDLHRQGVFGGVERAAVDLVLEGGAVETDGRGTLLATRSSVLAETRNPGLDAAALEDRLAGLLGIRRFLWLDHGALAGDDTDGHIDTLARFADPGTIVHVSCRRGDPDAREIGAMTAELSALRTAEGRPYRLVPLPPPGAHQGSDGRPLAASYANFLIVNGAVLVPVYGDPADQEAVETLAHCFPGRRAIPVDCRPLIRQNGSLHCVTMQLPAALRLPAGPAAA
jgi:agmatine/peptidylarginine deiminase